MGKTLYTIIATTAFYLLSSSVAEGIESRYTGLSDMLNKKPRYSNEMGEQPKKLEAVVLLSGKELEKRANFLEKSKSVEAKVDLAAIYADLGRFDESIELSTTLLEMIDNKNQKFLVHYNRGRAYGLKGSSKKEVDKAIIEYDKAINDFKRALEIIPGHNEGRLILAEIYNAKGDFDNAIEAYGRVIEKQPKIAYTRCKLGQVLGLKGKLKEAETSFNSALEIDKNYVSAHFGLGILYGMRKKFDKAEAKFRKVVELEPKNSKAHFYLADTICNQGDEEERIIEAIEHLILADELDSAKSFYKKLKGDGSFEAFKKKILIEHKKAADK